MKAIGSGRMTACAVAGSKASSRRRDVVADERPIRLQALEQAARDEVVPAGRE